LEAVRADPADAIGFGEKSYQPWELRRGESLVGAPDPAVTRRLLAEALDAANPEPFRLAMLHLLARRADAEVDAGLVAALADPKLRAVAAYGLGRAGFKDYPARQRDPRR